MRAYAVIIIPIAFQKLPFMIHDDQHIEKAAGHRRNHKEIHRYNGASMVLEKGPPTL